MSYTVTGKCKAFAEDPAKLKRAPEVLEALAKLHNWQVQTTATECRVRANGYEIFHLDLRTGTHRFDSDFHAVGKIMSRDGVLTDQYEAADGGVYFKQTKNYDWVWVGDSLIDIDDTVDEYA